jgi:UDP-glucose 4-epimerase
MQELLKERWKTQGRQPTLEFYEADYSDKQTVRLILSKYTSCLKHVPEQRVDAENDLSSSSIKGVIHFAAYKAIGESIKMPLKYYANNVCGLVNFCSLLGDFGIKKFIFSSSATVYGVSHPTGDKIIEETCTHEQTSYLDSKGKVHLTFGGFSGLTNLYGRSKWMCESVLSDLALADDDWTIFALRYFNPIGCNASANLGKTP